MHVETERRKVKVRQEPAQKYATGCAVTIPLVYRCIRSDTKYKDAWSTHAPSVIVPSTHLASVSSPMLSNTIGFNQLHEGLLTSNDGAAGTAEPQSLVEQVSKEVNTRGAARLFRVHSVVQVASDVGIMPRSSHHITFIAALFEVSLDRDLVVV